MPREPGQKPSSPWKLLFVSSLALALLVAARPGSAEPSRDTAEASTFDSADTSREVPSAGERRVRQLGWGALATVVAHGFGVIGGHAVETASNCEDQEVMLSCLDEFGFGYLGTSFVATTLGTGFAVDGAGTGETTPARFWSTAAGGGVGFATGLAGGFATISAAPRLDGPPRLAVLLAPTVVGGAAGSVAGYEIAATPNDADSPHAALGAPVPWVRTSEQGAGAGLRLSGTF